MIRLALRDCKRSLKLLLNSVGPEIVKQIKANLNIKVDDFGDFPRCGNRDKMSIKDQKRSKAEQATKELYKKEFHSGVLKEKCASIPAEAYARSKDILIEIQGR